MGRDFVKHVGRYFVPTTVELIAVGLFVFSICMYFVAILFVYDETTVDSMVSLQADIKASLQTFVANPYVDVVWHGVFWFIAGAVGLSVLWGLAVLFIDIRNDMVISSNFVHPKSFHHADIWVASIARLVVRVAFVAGGGLFAIRLAGCRHGLVGEPVMDPGIAYCVCSHRH